MLTRAVIKGTSVYRVAVFKLDVVFSDSKKQIKKNEKNRLMTNALGMVVGIARLFDLLKRTSGSKIMPAPAKRSSVRETGLTMSARASDAKNEPAISMAASMTQRWYFSMMVLNNIGAREHNRLR